MSEFPRRLAQYDPTSVIFTWGGIALNIDSSSGSFVTLERVKAMWRLVIGIDGEPTRVRSNNRAGIIRFRMRQAAVNADALAALLTINENTGLYGAIASLPFFLTDIPSGTTLWSSPVALLEGWPLESFGTSEGDREWTLLCNPLLPHPGGRASP